jgi:hypothetical protein
MLNFSSNYLVVSNGCARGVGSFVATAFFGHSLGRKGGRRRMDERKTIKFVVFKAICGMRSALNEETLTKDS